MLFSRNSQEGELGSAFVEQHYSTLEHVKFSAPPPELIGIPMNAGNTTRATSPNAPVLHDIYPNPVRSTAAVPFDLPAPAVVEISVYDMLGRRLLQQGAGMLQPGRHERHIDLSDFAGGIYICELRAIRPDGALHRDVTYFVRVNRDL